MAPCNCNLLHASKLLVGASTVFFLLVAFPSAAPLSFNFTSFDPVNTREQITFDGDASVANSSILLTKNLLHLPQDQRNQSIGRASFSRPIHLHDAASGSLADFATHFSFVINSIDNTTYADGIAFFFAPVDLPFPSVRFGGGLGLVDGVGTSNRFVAVEFDTFSNEWDPVGGSHVGIDVNTMISAVNTTWFSSIRDGRTNDASISYDSRSKNLTVSFTGFRNGTRFLQSLSYSIDLRTVLPEYVKFGFSGATGESFELHTIQSWSFNSPDLQTGGKRMSKSTRTKLVAGVIAGVSAGLVMAALYLVYFLFWKKEKSRDDDDDDHASHDFIDDELDSNAGPRRFSYRELARATGNFSDASKLGAGGFGSVYKGVLSLKGSDEQVAVKRVSRDSKQGIREYAAEIRSISLLRHRNLVQLMGWCHQKRDSLLLVYEFMPNGSLDSHLFWAETESGTVLTWARRYRIALNLASALLYLQEEWDQCVVHRDIKSSNVMLDSDFNAKLGDFGLARLVDHAKGARTTAVAGTMGYMAPECVTAGRAAKESDVYSFGIVLLEIACGRRPMDPDAAAAAEGGMLMVEWAWNLYGGGRVLEAADGRLRGDFDEREMQRLMVVGLWCAHPDQALRPAIREAIAALKFEAGLPYLPPKMPMPVYVVPGGSMGCAISVPSSSSGAWVGSSVCTNDDTSQPFTPPSA